MKRFDRLEEAIGLRVNASYHALSPNCVMCFILDMGITIKEDE